MSKLDKFEGFIDKFMVYGLAIIFLLGYFHLKCELFEMNNLIEEINVTIQSLNS
jgi:hypothetical protein